MFHVLYRCFNGFIFRLITRISLINERWKQTQILNFRLFQTLDISSNPSHILFGYVAPLIQSEKETIKWKILTYENKVSDVILSVCPLVWSWKQKQQLLTLI